MCASEHHEENLSLEDRVGAYLAAQKLKMYNDNSGVSMSEVDKYIKEVRQLTRIPPDELRGFFPGQS
jgi:hypothetical protein